MELVEMDQCIIIWMEIVRLKRHFLEQEVRRIEGNIKKWYLNEVFFFFFFWIEKCIWRIFNFCCCIFVLKKNVFYKKWKIWVKIELISFYFFRKEKIKLI